MRQIAQANIILNSIYKYDPKYLMLPNKLRTRNTLNIDCAEINYAHINRKKNMSNVAQNAKS